MKKLIALLTVFSVAGVSATSVVSCGVKTDPIGIYLDDADKSIKEQETNINSISYTAKQLATATNGFSQSYKGREGYLVNPAMTFSELNDMLFRVMANDARLITKPQENQKQLHDSRDTFIGRFGNDADAAYQSVNDKGIYTPSVDGSRISSLESDESKYYDKFGYTHVNSINGLHDLSAYSGDVSGLAALNESKTEANNLFGAADNDANAFYESYHNSTKYSSFVGVRYALSDDQSGSVLQEYKTMSSVFTYNKNDGSISQAPASYVSYAAANNIKDEDQDSEKTKPLGQRTKSDPYARLILPAADSLDPLIGTNAAPTLNLPDGLDAGGIMPENTTFAEKISSISATPSVDYVNTKTKIKDSNNNDVDGYSFVYNQNSFYYAKAKPIKVTYSFAPNTKTSKDQTYQISFTLNNLVEVFTPIVQSITQTDDQKKDNTQSYQVIWLFNGYKFFNVSDDRLYSQNTLINSKDKDQTKYQAMVEYELNHQLRDLYTSGWEIKKNSN